MVRVTIGIPVKNSERTIASCLRTLLNVEIDKSDVEIIIVDGGSKDHTLEIAQEMLEKCSLEYRILYDKGRGVAYARQVVVNEAGADYIAWIDSDNTISRDFFTKSLSVLESLPNVAATFPILVPTGSKRLAERLQVYYLASMSPSEKDNAKQQKSSTPLGTQGTMCRVKAIVSVGGFDTKLLAGEDIDLFIRMSEGGWRFSSAPTYVYYYVRESWRDVFSQAIWWGCGRYQLSMKYPNVVHPLIRFTDVRARKIAPIIYTVDALRTTLKAAKTFGTSEVLLIPLYYVYRRMGFFWGNRMVKRLCPRL